MPEEKNQPSNTDACQEIWGCFTGSHPNGTCECNPLVCLEISNSSEEKNPIFWDADWFFVSPRKKCNML